MSVSVVGINELVTLGLIFKGDEASLPTAGRHEPICDWYAHAGFILVSYCLDKGGRYQTNKN